MFCHDVRVEFLSVVFLIIHLSARTLYSTSLLGAVHVPLCRAALLNTDLYTSALEQEIDELASAVEDLEDILVVQDLEDLREL